MDANKKYQILVVDDSEFSADTIKEIANLHEKCEVASVFNDPEKALTACEQTNYPIAIIDIVMPLITGLELTKKILSLSRETKIILVSSLSGESVILDAINSGAIDFIQKPFSKNSLLTSLDKAIQGIE